ncbi:CDP-glycerol glycerophosphotransferase family protein [Aeromonas bivalvium]|uniref:CDP-glycerol glycerophosphotransferase family protein n=1 Tax=Aeromonas bivalvium TaxID=440079 RepID=UPI0038CF78E9
MNIRKLKKLVKNPSQFFLDSKIANKISRNENDSTNKPSLGFIIVGSDPSLLENTTSSIDAARKKYSTVKFPYAIICHENSDSLNDDIKSAVVDINTEYVKIMHQGESLHAGFLKNYLENMPSHSHSEIILHSHTHDVLSCQNDPLIADIKALPSKDGLHIKNHLIPVTSVLILKSELLLNMKKFIFSDSIASKICNSLHILSLMDVSSNIQYLQGAFVSNIKSERLDAQLQSTIKNGDEFENILSNIESFLTSNSRTEQISKSIFCLIHNVVILLLRNKKADELLHIHTKNVIKDKITNIIKLLGLNTLNSYSANNYNHVHKIGYLRFLGLNAERDLCYIEDVDTKSHRLKFKIASHNETLPHLFLNKEKVIPLSIKIRELTIFDLSFSYEIYFWLPYRLESHEFYIENEFKTEIMVSGKRQLKPTIKNILNSHFRKNAISGKLPHKAQWLRYVSSLYQVKNKFKDAWIFIDNEIRADDNAEHFYRYVAKTHSNINSFFLISKSSPDWQRLSNEGFKLINFGSLTHRLALLNAKYLLSSHANPAIVNYLPRKHYSDIMNYKFVFLQHGITKDDQSEWLNSRKIDYLVTAARHEFSDISGRGRYRYTSQETVLTGFPRYDNLVKRDESKRQILIMPTWRKGLAGELIKKSSKRIKNPEFINSLFCEMWGGFLRSEMLRKSAEENKYSIIFLPHPNLTDYLEELAIPDYIQVGDLTSCSIQETFKDADVLITDYSSVAFDVAYMKKPVIYFQFDSDTFFSEHSYSKGYYDYETLGFGPVVSDIHRLNKELKNMLAHECILTPFYMERINSFFPYDDHDNSSRLFKLLNNEGVRNYDHKTLIEYLALYASNIELESIADVLDRFEISLKGTPQWLHEPLIEILKDIIFLSALDNNNFILSKSENIYEAISSIEGANFSPPEKSTIINDTDQLLQYIDRHLLGINGKPHLIKKSNQRLGSYFNALHDFSRLYKEQDYQSALAIYDHQLAVSAHTVPRNVSLLRCLALIKNGDISTAVNLFSILQLTPDEKEHIILELYKHHKPENRQSLELSALLPIKGNSTTAIETFLLLSQHVPENLLSHFDNKNVMPDSILIHYLNRLFKEKDFTGINSFLSDKLNKTRYLVSDSNRAKYLFTVFVSSGIEKFLSELLEVTGNDNLVHSINHMFISNDDMDLDVLFKIIESVISKDLYPFSCAEIYQYALFFFKKSRPGLAKKLTTLSIMKKHEEYYSNGSNWKNDDDYRTLLTAVSELNSAMEGLNRIV